MSVPIREWLSSFGGVDVGAFGCPEGSSFFECSVPHGCARAGFSFGFGRAFMPCLEPELDNIIRQALANAQAAGRVYLSQTEEAHTSG